MTTSDAVARLFTEPAVDPTWFSESFLATVPMEKVASIIADVLATLGAYKDLAPNGTSYTLTFAKGTLQAEAAINETGAFTGLTFNRMQSAVAEERLTALIQTTEVPTAWFSDLFLAAVPIEQVTSILNEMKATSGAFRSIFAAPDGTYDIALAKGRYSARIYLGRDGKILGLISGPSKESRMKVTGLDASYYYAKDFDRAVSFYTAMIGSAPPMVVPGMFAEWEFAGGEAFGLYKGDEYQHCDGIMFAVDDVAAAVAELRARGVHFADDGKVEDTPVCHMAFGTDSEGNGFILHKRK